MSLICTKFRNIGMLFQSNVLFPVLHEAKHFEEIVLLKGNLPIFSLLNLNIRLFINVRRHDCVMSMAGL